MIDNNDDKDLLLGTVEDLPMEIKLLIEIREHRTESRMQAKHFEARLDKHEKMIEENQKLAKELTKEMTWGKGALKGIFWLGGGILAIWSALTAWFKLFGGSGG